MTNTATVLPLRPTASHPANASHPCAWCGCSLASVPELLDHVVDSHLDSQQAA